MTPIEHYQEPNIKKIAWNGSGNAVTKTVSCAEIMKRRIKVILKSKQIIAEILP